MYCGKNKSYYSCPNTNWWLTWLLDGIMLLTCILAIFGAAASHCAALLSGEVSRHNLCWRNDQCYETHECSYQHYQLWHQSMPSWSMTYKRAPVIPPWQNKSNLPFAWIRRYLDEEQKEILCLSSPMDPRFKALPVLSEDKRQDIYVRVIAEATRSQWFSFFSAERDWSGDRRDWCRWGAKEAFKILCKMTSLQPHQEPKGFFHSGWPTWTNIWCSETLTQENHTGPGRGETRRQLPCHLLKPVHWTSGNNTRASIHSSHLAKRYLCIPGVSPQRECPLPQGIWSQHRGVH